MQSKFRNKEFLSLPTIEAFPNSTQKDLLVYRYKPHGWTDERTIYTQVIDFGVMSVMNYAAAHVFAEYMRMESADFFIAHKMIVKRVNIDVMRAGTNILIMINLMGNDNREMERLGERFIQHITVQYTETDPMRFEMIRSRVANRLETPYSTVMEFAHDDANDIFLSNGHIEGLRAKTLSLLKYETDQSTLSHIIREKFFNSPKRIVMEIGGRTDEYTLFQSDTFGDLKPRVIIEAPDLK